MKALLFAVLLVLAGLRPGWAAEALRIGLLPGETAPHVIRQFEPFRQALEGALGERVQLTVGLDYASTVEALRFGRLDLAFLGPASYVLLRSRAPAEPLVRPSSAGRSSFQAAVIVPAGSTVRGFADLRGQTIAFGDVASTGGHVIPREMLQQAGLAAGRDYQPRFLGAHDAVALGVANGRVAAAGISLPALERLMAQGTILQSKVRILALSEPVPEYAFVAAPGLPTPRADRIRAALMALPSGPALTSFRADRFVPANAADYDGVEAVMRRLGLLQEKRP